jgi:hypothetical protein
MLCMWCSRFSYFAIICNDDEYKMMNLDQDKSLGQLYNVQNWIAISNFIQPNSFIMTILLKYF